jgi:hypothetical protein
MTAHRLIMLVALTGAALFQACSDDGGDVVAPDPGPQPTAIVQLSGAVEARIPEFAAAIGGVDNKGEPGPLPTGRRQINWDGVPAQFLNTPDFPADFFKGRGLVYGGSTGLRVSDNNFADINPSYATEFIPFSAPKLFAAVGTTTVEVLFRIPGSDTEAAVRSFGAVMEDVDKANTSRLQAYDRAGKLIADVPAPVRADPDEFSLVGVSFEQPIITRVVLTLGEVPLGAGIDDLGSGGAADVVVVDDFLYSEPQPLPAE